MGEWKFRPLHFRKSCGRILIQVNKDMTGVGGRRYPPGPVKREAGARPARSRRCERGVLFPPQVRIICKLQEPFREPCNQKKITTANWIQNSTQPYNMG